MLSAGVKKVRREILTHFLFLLLGRQTSAPSSEESPPPPPLITAAFILIIDNIRSIDRKVSRVFVGVLRTPVANSEVTSRVSSCAPAPAENFPSIFKRHV